MWNLDNSIKHWTRITVLRKAGDWKTFLFISSQTLSRLLILNSYSRFMSNAESCKMIKVVWLQLTAGYCVICIITLVCSRYYNPVVFEPIGRADSLCLLHMPLKFVGDTSCDISPPFCPIWGIKHMSISCPSLLSASN